MEEIKFLAGIPNKPVVFIISSGKLADQVELSELILKAIKNDGTYGGKYLYIGSLDGFIADSQLTFVYPDFSVLFGWNFNEQYKKLDSSLNIIRVRIDSSDLSRYMESDLPRVFYPSLTENVLMMADDAEGFYDYVFYKEDNLEKVVDNVIKTLLRGVEEDERTNG